MSTVLEEKIPRIQNNLIQQFGQVSESAVDAVTQGIKTAVSMGIATSSQDKTHLEIQNFAYRTMGSNELGPLIGTKFSEAAGIGTPQEFFQGQFKGMEKAHNAELNAFAKKMFGKGGLLNSLEEKGFVIYGSEKTNQAEKGAIAPEYVPAREDLQGRVASLQDMHEILKKTLLVQQDLKKFNWPVKA